MKKWQIQPKAPEEFFAQFPEYDPLILQLLYNRGIKTQTQIDEFFNPDWSQDLYDPFLLLDMEKACHRLEQAVLRKERVGVYGDYDADGVTSAVILTDFLKNILGLSGQVYIPDRQTEGYGLNKRAIDWLRAKNIKLIITCDCGVANKEEIDYGKSQGLDFIVLDHHFPYQEFSNDYIVVNPKRKGSRYPWRELAGCGVVFKFIQAFLRKKKKFIESILGSCRLSENKKNEVEKMNFEAYEKWLVDLVAIATVADCVPMISENRTLVKYGLRVLAKTKRVGLQKLIEKAGINLEKLSTYELSFLVAPRLNAAGRIDHATQAYKLLATKDSQEAERIAQDLEEKNYQRQKLSNEMFLEAKEQITKLKGKRRVLFVIKEGWPVGLLGLVAGKLCEEFSQPVFVLAKGKEESVGSARSIPQFNIIEAITKCGDLLLEYGGHKQAAGISLKNQNLERFFDKLENYAREKLSDSDLIPTIKVDAPLDLARINFQLYDELQKFEPHGPENPKPIFVAYGVRVLDIQLVGSRREHFKMYLTQPKDEKQKIYEAVGFNQANGIFSRVSHGDLVDIVYEIKENNWNGQRKLELKILDFVRSSK